jgi:hypothetical protein
MLGLPQAEEKNITERKQQKHIEKQAQVQLELNLKKFSVSEDTVKKKVLAVFREYLVELGNKNTVQAYDRKGINDENIAIMALFKVFMSDYDCSWT